jgi:four helix bundle protein
VAVIWLVKALPRSPEFAAKLGVVLEEADESEFWLDILKECELAPTDRVSPLLSEAAELTKVFAASVKTARGNLTRHW